jgi:hypothetical protein
MVQVGTTEMVQFNFAKLTRVLCKKFNIIALMRYVEELQNATALSRVFLT